MDFSLIEKHPWVTTGIVFGGGFLLFLVMRSRSSTTAPAATGTSYVGVDPATAQLNAQTAAQASQSATYIQGLNIQGATQVSLAQIGADASKYSIGASAETVDTQTAAQLALGLGTLNAQVQTTAIGASVQMKYIDAIVAAFTGNSNPSISTPPVSTPVFGQPTPSSQTTPPVYVYVQSPGGTGGTYPVAVGGTNPGTLAPGSAPLPGGTLLTPYPQYANCDPRDVACVMGNGVVNVNWENSSVANNAQNNRNQCLANAAMSKGMPNYNALVSACG